MTNISKYSRDNLKMNLLNIKNELMKIAFRWYHPFVLIEKLAERLNTESRIEYAEKLIELPEAYGKGQINGFKFRNGISLLLFDVKLRKEWELKFYNDVPPPLQLNLLSEGSLNHSIDEGQLKYNLKSMESSITSSSLSSSQTIILPKGKRVIFASVFINRSEYFSEFINVKNNEASEISKLFFDTEGEDYFFYKSNFSIDIARALRSINSRFNDGIIRSIMVESIVLQMIGFKMRKFQEDIHFKGKKVNLKRHEVNQIKLARDILIDDLVDAPTIEGLSRAVGINQQKLKQDFKVVYGMTINQYLTNARLEYAVSNLERGQTVRETAMEIGYANLSHFAKKFKDKFGLLPKDYVKSLQTKVAVRSR